MSAGRQRVTSAVLHLIFRLPREALWMWRRLGG
jgi:hypothetical protein